MEMAPSCPECLNVSSEIQSLHLLVSQLYSIVLGRFEHQARQLDIIVRSVAPSSDAGDSTDHTSCVSRTLPGSTLGIQSVASCRRLDEGVFPPLGLTVPTSSYFDQSDDELPVAECASEASEIETDPPDQRSRHKLFDYCEITGNRDGIKGCEDIDDDNSLTGAVTTVQHQSERSSSIDDFGISDPIASTPETSSVQDSYFGISARCHPETKNCHDETTASSDTDEDACILNGTGDEFLEVKPFALDASMNFSLPESQLDPVHPRNYGAESSEFAGHHANTPSGKRLSIYFGPENTCTICGQDLGSARNAYYHVESHLFGKQYRCPLCPRTAARKTNLNRHLKTVHKAPSNFLFCGRCPKVFNDAVAWKRHCSAAHRCSSEASGEEV